MTQGVLGFKCELEKNELGFTRRAGLPLYLERVKLTGLYRNSDKLAGGSLPSGDFGENAAWWWFMVLALNLNEAMKRHVLQGGWTQRRMKAIRFGVINLVGRVVEKARQLRIRLGKPAIGYELFLRARERMVGWKEVTPS